MTVLRSDYSDGSAEFTVREGEESHRFSAFPKDGDAIVSYEETLSWRGVIRVSEPTEDLFRTLAQSPEMDAYLVEHGLESVKREWH